jgi:serine/threonine protein kinase
MKAVRERARAALTINIRKADKAGERKKITEVTEAQVATIYKIGKMVMESTNTGMDVIFATRLKDNVEVVIKTRIKKESFKTSAEEREWRITTEYQLNMPKVDTLCQFHEVLETKIKYYVVMEKVEGQDLFEQMAKEKITHVESRDIIYQILNALRVMHADGRIHRDLKIENVMVADVGAGAVASPKKPKDGESGFEPCSPTSAKLIDFDTVQDWEPTSPKTKDVLGTDGYIAPEAYGGEYSPASDVYSVGVIMYKLLTRKFPSRTDIFDDLPGENWVGSPAMKRIQGRLKTEKMDFSKPPLDKCAEASSLLQGMLAYNMADRPTAEEALNHDWFKLRPEDLK